MNHRPLIGINADFRVTAKDRTSFSLIPSGYYDCLLTANALPVMIPPLVRESSSPSSNTSTAWCSPAVTTSTRGRWASRPTRR